MLFRSRQRKQIYWRENTFCAIAPRQEYFWRQQCCLETYRVPPATGLTACGEKRLGTGLRRRLGRADRGVEGRFREKSGVPTTELCGTAHVYRSAAREWLCVGKYGLRGVLWERICDCDNRDNGRIKSYNKIKQ